jgi:hypothetical protein
VNDATMEPKRWKLVRAAIWVAIVLAAAVFWTAVGAGVLAWLR